MRQLVLYIHGKAMEADHYKTLFAGYDGMGRYNGRKVT